MGTSLIPLGRHDHKEGQRLMLTAREVHAAEANGFFVSGAPPPHSRMFVTFLLLDSTVRVHQAGKQLAAQFCMRAGRRGTMRNEPVERGNFARHFVTMREIHVVLFYANRMHGRMP